jgi:1-deoxy-D-xylulose-5-phosphate synthase
VATIESTLTAAFGPHPARLPTGRGAELGGGVGAAHSGLLAAIDGPAELRRLPESALAPLADELRAYLIASVANGGGHFAAGLGTVELTLALHYVFRTPEDRLVWDVGHQCYPHKILTGRRDALGTIRRRGGLSGFLRRDESAYDAFGAGHAGTSVSAALGMAVAAAQQGLDRRTVAIIGDGAMTAGLAFEAVDHAGASDADLLIVLNDNQMSISPNVGALSRYLARLAGRLGSRRRLLPRGLRGYLGDGEPLAQASEPGRLFTDLGCRYVGTVDGHDLGALVAAFREQRAQHGPRLLHVVTKKGRGYAPAEADPTKYHGVTPFRRELGIQSDGAKPARTYTQVFGDWLCAAAGRDERVVAITPAMREGSGLVDYAARFPRRYHDVGIAEQHSVTFAAGLAAEGLRPVVAIYSTFLQRAYDQLIHDVALQRLPVLFAIDRAGLVGPDGATHNGSFDLSYLRCVPGLVVMTPSDAAQLRDMLDAALALGSPVAVRYPRASAGRGDLDAPPRELRIGTGEVRRNGSGCAILAFGTLLGTALEVAADLDATVVDMRFVKPLDVPLLLDLASRHELLVTVEENAVAGGAGAAATECLAAHDVPVSILNLGLPDRYAEHATRDEVLADAGLDRAGIKRAILERLATRAARKLHGRGPG